MNQCPLQWKCRVLTTGLPGKSHSRLIILTDSVGQEFVQGIAEASYLVVGADCWLGARWTMGQNRYTWHPVVATWASSRHSSPGSHTTYMASWGCCMSVPAPPSVTLATRIPSITFCWLQMSHKHAQIQEGGDVNHPIRWEECQGPTVRRPCGMGILLQPSLKNAICY